MAEPENGWHELLKTEIADGRQFRTEIRAAQAKTDEQLDRINTTLTELKTERRMAGWALGTVVPATVALAVTTLAKKLGF